LRKDEIALAEVGGALPLSARAASASVPSDALTAATPRNDQRLAANNSIAVAISRPTARNMQRAPCGPPQRWGGVGPITAQATQGWWKPGTRGFAPNASQSGWPKNVASRDK
jgi:hypothetical protein